MGDHGDDGKGPAKTIQKNKPKVKHTAELAKLLTSPRVLKIFIYYLKTI